MFIHFENVHEIYMAVKPAIDENKTQIIQKKILKWGLMKLFNIVTPC